MNSTKAYFLIIVLLLPATASFSQQEPTSVLFWNNYLHTNPAMAGAVYKHHGNVTWNDYFLKKPYAIGIPYQQTINVNYAAKVDRINSGVGACYRYDSRSGLQMQTALLSYAYHIPIKSLFLSIGASGGIKTLNYPIPDSSGTLVKQQYNPVFSSDFGIALRHEKWNAGISVTQWNGATLRMKDSLDYNYGLVPHFWLFGDYRFVLGEKWSLTPRLQLLMDNNFLHSNIQVLASWKENLWFGVGVQNLFQSNMNIFVSPMIGCDIKGRFRLGYAAVISTRNNFSIFRTVTHEAVLSLLLK